jgi:hypothetical protein
VTAWVVSLWTSQAAERRLANVVVATARLAANTDLMASPPPLDPGRRVRGVVFTRG